MADTRTIQAYQVTLQDKGLLGHKALFGRAPDEACRLRLTPDSGHATEVGVIAPALTSPKCFFVLFAPSLSGELAALDRHGRLITNRREQDRQFQIRLASP